MSFVKEALTRTGLVAGAEEADGAAQWYSSPQRRLAARRSRFWWTAAGAALVALVVFLYHNSNPDTGDLSPTTLDKLWAAISGFLALVLVAAGILVRLTAHRAWKTSRMESSREDVVDAKRKLDADPSPGNLASYNRSWLLRYHEITLAQATSAYRFAQLSALAGFGVLLLGVASAIWVPDVGSKVTSAALTGMASMLAAYISRTFKVTYERTLLQLDHFFEQPLVDSYLIMAERLCANEPFEIRSPFLHRLLAEAVRGATTWSETAAAAMVDADRPSPAPASTSAVAIHKTGAVVAAAAPGGDGNGAPADEGNGAPAMAAAAAAATGQT